MGYPTFCVPLHQTVARSCRGRRITLTACGHAKRGPGSSIYIYIYYTPAPQAQARCGTVSSPSGEVWAKPQPEDRNGSYRGPWPGGPRRPLARADVGLSLPLRAQPWGQKPTLGLAHASGLRLMRAFLPPTGGWAKPQPLGTETGPVPAPGQPLTQARA